VDTEIVWVVGRYALLALLYLFVILVLRALILEMRSEPLPSAPPAPVDAPIAVPTSPEDTVDHGHAPAPTPPPAPVVPAKPLANRTASESLHGDPLPPRLVVVESGDPAALPTGTTFPLSAVTTIGRGAHNVVALPGDQFASTNHALVFSRDGAPHVRDRGSTNGTLLNGGRLVDEGPLSDGDRISIGTTVLLFAAGEEPRSDAASPEATS